MQPQKIPSVCCLQMVQQINYNVYRISLHQSEARMDSSDPRGPFHTGRPK